MKNAKFDENFEIRERCEGVHCVDLGESFPTRIYLQNTRWKELPNAYFVAKFGFDTAENEPTRDCLEMAR